jgi:Domain of unknown function (DUF5658)
MDGKVRGAWRMPEGDNRATSTVASALHRVYPARLEVEPEPEPQPAPVRYAALRQTLHDPVSMLFLLGALLGQVADTVTTAVALSGNQYIERNGLLREAVTQPIEVGLCKLLLVFLVSLLAMLRLPTRQARLALFFAFGLSVFAPIQNLVQLLH